MDQANQSSSLSNIFDETELPGQSAPQMHIEREIVDWNMSGGFPEADISQNDQNGSAFQENVGTDFSNSSGQQPFHPNDQKQHSIDQNTDSTFPNRSFPSNQQPQERSSSTIPSYNVQAQEYSQPPQEAGQPKNDAVIELLDDDDDDNAVNTGTKRQLSEMSSSVPSHAPSSASYQARNANLPGWMKKSGNKIVPGYSIPEYREQNQQQLEAQTARDRERELNHQNQAVYVKFPSSFAPTWTYPLPAVARRHTTTHEARHYELSLLNVQEFTITGLATTFEGPPSSVAGLRKTIKEISRDYGKATFEREGDKGAGRWRIPLVRHLQSGWIICFCKMRLTYLFIYIFVCIV
jgi:hypothetical protein